jgi:hypothetical protein
VPSRYVQCAVVRKNETGAAVDCSTVRSWYLAGLSPKTATKFIASRIGVETAIAWVRAGFLSAEAVQLIERGISLESEKSQFANIPYSKAFRRAGATYTPKGDFNARVSAAVSALDVPSIYSSSMFSSASNQVSCLDGGYMEVRGYGFGSHSYSCIVGDKALRFVCSRIGVQPPRGDSQDIRDLEVILTNQRLNHWGDLVAQATISGLISAEKRTSTQT